MCRGLKKIDMRLKDGECHGIDEDQAAEAVSSGTVHF